MDKKIICLLGMPGSGKGSLAKNIIKKYNAAHLSSGEVLRQQNDPQLEKIMKSGNLVPSELCIPLVINKLNQTEQKVVILDGVLRSSEQYLVYAKKMNKIVLLVWLFCSDDVVIERIKKRALSEPERKESWDCTQKRIAVYKEVTSPLFERMKQDGIRCLSINTGNKTPEEVFELFESKADDLLTESD